MKYRLQLIPVILCTLLIGVTACSDSGSGPENEFQVETYTARDIPADTAESGEYTFFSLRENTMVQDSASSNWDIALSGTTIRFNSGTSGPGDGGAILLDVAFEDVTTAPSEGYRVDGDGELAVPTGDENGWYNYTSTDQNPNHAILPIEGKTIILKTGNGQYYAKLRILSYYEGNPYISSDQQYPPSGSRMYTFEYTIQLNGSREFIDE